MALVPSIVVALPEVRRETPWLLLLYVAGVSGSSSRAADGRRTAVAGTY